MGNKQSVRKQDIQIDELSSVEDSGLELLKQKYFPFENLIFEGGHNKLLAYCGTVKILEETGVWNRILRLAGSGSGALAAALLAIGNKSNHLEKIFLDNSFPDLLSGRKNEKKVIKWIREQLKESTGKADITFEEVYWRFRKELCIVLTNVSSGRVEYCHVKTTPDLPIATAVCMSIESAYGTNWKTKHVLSGGCEGLFTGGQILLNYPIHCFDGWWLSMKPENSFLNRIQDLNDLPKILERRNRFGEFNRATIGLSVFDDSSLDNFLLSLPTGKKENPQETNLTKIRSDAYSNHVTNQENYSQLVTSLNKLLQVVKQNGPSDQISRKELTDILQTGFLTDHDLHVIFGTKPNADEIIQQISHNNELRIDDLTEFLNRKRSHAHAQCSRDHYRPIKKPEQYWDAIAEILQENNFRFNTKKTDSKRTVGINTGFIRRSDLGSTLENHDRSYLVHQGKLAMRIFLERYDNSVMNEITKVSEVDLEHQDTMRQDAMRQNTSRKQNENDLKQYIDDDISEVIDEREYMDTYFDKVL